MSNEETPVIENDATSCTHESGTDDTVNCDHQSDGITYAPPKKMKCKKCGTRYFSPGELN